MHIALLSKNGTYCEKLQTVPVSCTVVCLLEPQLQMIKNTVKYINLMLVNIKSTYEAPGKKEWQGSSHLSRVHDCKLHHLPNQ